jgi:predicted Zn finger-like uncharacterized protein
MILSCTACSTRYVVDPALLGPDGRTVRCANCGHQWHQRAPIDFPQILQPEAPPSAPAGDPASRAPGANLPGFPRRRQSGAGLAWAVLALAVIIVALAAWVGRDAIMAAWPPSERLYAALGGVTEPLGAGLEFRNVKTERRLESNREVVVIEGDVVNTSNRDREVPLLRAALTADGRELTAWTFQATQSRLLPGESARFVTRTDEPTEDASGLSLDFAARK